MSNHTGFNSDKDIFTNSVLSKHYSKSTIVVVIVVLVVVVVVVVDNG